jgi:hypothetical protein
MKRQLNRILRIRELIEDLSRIDFEGKAAEVRHLELSAERQRRLALDMRAAALRILTAKEPVEREAWLMEIADAEIFGWKEAKLEALAETRRPIVDGAREELLDRRRDRLQVEILHTDAVREDEKCQIHREQNRTDDWFQSQSERRDRKLD